MYPGILWDPPGLAARKQKEQQLQYQHSRYAEFKERGAHLVPEKIHTCQYADTSTQAGGKKQRLFRNAPTVPDGLEFIGSHEAKGQGVDQEQIQIQQFQNSASLS